MSRTVLLPLLAGLVMTAGARAQSVTHRWSFNSTGPTTNGTVIPDAISGAPGTIRGNGATLTGGQLILPGTSNGNQTPAAISAYFDLPNGIISSKANFTLEIWASVKSAQNWQRLFDFGQMNTIGSGEITGLESTAPGTTQRRDGIMFSPTRSGNLTSQRLSGRNDGGTEYLTDSSVTMVVNTPYYFAVTYQSGVGVYSSTGGQVKWYRDATLVGTVDMPIQLNQINDVNNWLGRSQSSSHTNANIAYNEVRLYDYALTQTQITASNTHGQNKVFPQPITAADSITMNRGQKAKIDVLANDVGEIARSSLSIDQAPLFGTATVTSDNQIVYTQTTGTPTTDSLTYRISNTTGQSSTAVVSISFAT